MAARNLALILPFTPGILKDLSALLPIIFEAAQLPTESLTVVFSTPGSETQLYAELRKAPKAHFEELQVFLGKVYAALAAGQWTANRVLLEVEVRFDGELGDWSEKLQAVPDEVVRLEGASTGHYPANAVQVSRIWERTSSLPGLRTQRRESYRRESFPRMPNSKLRRRWAGTLSPRLGGRSTTCMPRTRFSSTWRCS